MCSRARALQSIEVLQEQMQCMDSGALKQVAPQQIIRLVAFLVCTGPIKDSLYNCNRYKLSGML